MCIGIDAEATSILLALEQSSKVKYYQLLDTKLSAIFEKPLDHKGGVKVLEMLPGNRVFVSYTDEMEVKIWSADGTCLSTFNTHQVRPPPLPCKTMRVRL